MATAEYYRKQVELLLVWAMATAEPVVKAKLLSRALEFLALIDNADDRLLRLFQEVLAEFNAQLPRAPRRPMTCDQSPLALLDRP